MMVESTKEEVEDVERVVAEVRTVEVYEDALKRQEEWVVAVQALRVWPALRRLSALAA